MQIARASGVAIVFLCMTGCVAIADGFYIQPALPVAIAVGSGQYSVRFSDEPTNEIAFSREGRATLPVRHGRWSESRIFGLAFNRSSSEPPLVEIIRDGNVVKTMSVAEINKLPRDSDGCHILVVGG